MDNIYNIIMENVIKFLFVKLLIIKVIIKLYINYNIIIYK